jgi:hypothetical protein
MYEGKKAAFFLFLNTIILNGGCKKKARIIPSSFDSPSQGHLIEVTETY